VIGLVLAAAAASLIGAPPDWRGETFEFPLPFAPTIPYEGTEHVRFSPSWDKFSSENGFSYVFVWDLKAKDVAPEDLEDYLEAYFNGLMANVARARKLGNTQVKTAASAHPMTQVEGWTQGYGLELHTHNGFGKNEPLILYGEVTRRECAAGRMQIFFAFSRARRDRPIWEGLREARKATQCAAGGS
jgi:hypothetical protein